MSDIKTLLSLDVAVADARKKRARVDELAAHLSQLCGRVEAIESSLRTARAELGDARQALVDAAELGQ